MEKITIKFAWNRNAYVQFFVWWYAPVRRTGTISILQANLVKSMSTVTFFASKQTLCCMLYVYYVCLYVCLSIFFSLFLY